MKRLGFRAVAAVAMSTAAHAQAPENLTLFSPDRTIAVSVNAAAGNAISYGVARRGEWVIAPSRLRLQFDRKTPPLAGLAVENAPTRTVDTSYPIVAGKAATARDHYNELTVDLREQQGARRRIRYIFRAYDDGVAFRYVLPDQPNIRTLALRSEDSDFAFPADYACVGLNIGRADSSHEGEFDPVRASRIREYNFFDAPLTCVTSGKKTAFAIGEADLRDYGGMYLSGRGDGGLGVRTRISPRLDAPDLVVTRSMTPAGIQSPWRVVMMADRQGDLIASSLIANLNPPSAIVDTSWIRPGKTAWDWWSGPYLPPPAKGGTDMATIRRYIDFASQSGFPYMVIDEGWCLNSGVGGSAPADADITRAKPDIDMPALVAYARQRGVGLWLWVQWSLLDRQLEPALSRYQSWGIKGIKVDFMDRNDQQMVDYYHRVLSRAASHRIMVDLHGAFPPTGLYRTYPNFLTQEGILGAENNKWSRRVTATHNVTIPYTRMLLGPMDYTPGGFRNTTPQTFQIVNSPPQVMTTRGQALAMFVVYDSPLQMVSDSPDIYQGAAGFDFLKMVPTTWDETRFVAGDVGDYIVLARRKGTDWYIGAMGNEEGRSVTVPLDFLGTGRFAAHVWEDGDTPTTLKERDQKIDAKDQIRLRLAPSGGAAIRLSAAN